MDCKFCLEVKLSFMEKTMRRYKYMPMAVALLGVSFAGSASAQDAPATPPAATWTQPDTVRIVKEVQKKLGGLVTYGVFDWITFGTQGKTLVLKGYASRPVLKSDAESAVKGIAGVESVDNQIEVLPNLPFDDQIRQSVYNRIYGSSALSKYNGNAGRLGRGRSIARMAGGITNDPPLGYHAIHIIVKSGRVTLYGVVSNTTDMAIAGMQANSAPGAFSVDNDLVVEGAKAKSAAK
jgi:hyperosmotically inducible protein